MVSPPSRPPRILNVTHLGAPGTGTCQGDNIEAVLIARASMAQDPAPRQPFDHPPLLLPDRLFPGPAARRPPHLDLDECHHRASPGDEIEVVPAEAIAVGFNPPAALEEPARRDEFSLPTVAVADIGPFFGRNAHCGHAGTIASGGQRGGHF